MATVKRGRSLVTDTYRSDLASCGTPDAQVCEVCGSEMGPDRDRGGSTGDIDRLAERRFRSLRPLLAETTMASPKIAEAPGVFTEFAPLVPSDSVATMPRWSLAQIEAYHNAKDALARVTELALALPQGKGSDPANYRSRITNVSDDLTRDEAAAVLQFLETGGRNVLVLEGHSPEEAEYRYSVAARFWANGVCGLTLRSQDDADAFRAALASIANPPRTGPGITVYSGGDPRRTREVILGGIDRANHAKRALKEAAGTEGS